MYSLHRIKDGTYTIRNSRFPFPSATGLSFESAVSYLLQMCDISVEEIVHAFCDMELNHANYCEFGFNKTFVLSKFVNYAIN